MRAGGQVGVEVDFRYGKAGFYIRSLMRCVLFAIQRARDPHVVEADIGVGKAETSRLCHELAFEAQGAEAIARWKLYVADP